MCSDICASTGASIGVWCVEWGVDGRRQTQGALRLQGGRREGVARAKGEMFSSLLDDGTAVINGDDEFAPLWRELAGSRRQLVFARGKAGSVDELIVIFVVHIC